MALLFSPLGWLAPDTASAQFDARVDAGLGGTPAAQSASQARWSIAPGMTWTTSRVRVLAAGEYRDLGRAGHGLVGSAEASWFATPGRLVNLEFTALGRGLDGTREAFRGLWAAGFRLHLAGSERGLWLGSQVGGDRFGGSIRWEGAAWRRWGQVSVQIRGWQMATLNRLRETSPFDTLSPWDSLLRQQQRVRTDLGAWVRWTPGRFDLAAATGWRLGTTEPGGSLNDPSPGGFGQSAGSTKVRARQWWTAEGTWWFSDRVGIQSAIGTYAPDPALGTGGGRFFRLGMRATLSRGLGGSAARRLGHGFRTARTGQIVEFDLEAPFAERVELMADFTDWAPVEMAPAGGGRWRLEFAVEPGLHHVNVRYDQGPWRAPPGTRVVADEFGRQTGAVVID